jgi:hypothetical protein
MKTFLLSLAVMIGVLCVAPVSAQKMYVNPQIAADDLVGNNFAFHLKEAMRKSATYVVVDASDGKTTLEVDLLSLRESDYSSAISAVTKIPLGGGASLLVDHQIILVGKDRVDDMASTLLAAIDKSLSRLRAEADQPTTTNASK